VLLLDTHAWLWWLKGSSALGPQARARIASGDADVWISAASAWEIAIKVALGRLDLGEPPDVCLPREAARSGFRSLAITVEHAARVGRLPEHHRDPFDRLLIAQAQADGLTIVTSDPMIPKYGVPTLDAAR
jgi:PIN domain nuclease of toxin-antitoxin system